MRQFTQGNQQAFADLEQRLAHAELVFRDCEFPPGCQPNMGRVGFSRRGEDRYALMVDPGIRYQGNSPEILQLFRDSEIIFDSFGTLVEFCQDTVRKAFEATPAQDFTKKHSAMRTPSATTNLDAVSEALENQHRQQTMCLPGATNISQRIATEVFGQDDALKVIADRASLHIARIAPVRPSTLFLLGPTGVGKTSAAEALARILSDISSTNYRYLRLDMAEYQEAYRVSQLIGAPQGYVGHSDGAQLTRHLAKHPRSIILFDEIEKAHPDVFRMLMNLMDAGRLSSPVSIDGKYEINASEAILIFTSNLGADHLLAEVDSASANDHADPAALDEICRQHLVQHRIPKELVARIQAFALFRALSSKHRAEAMVRAIQKTGIVYGIQVRRVAPEIVAGFLARTEQKFGVRQDEYLIERELGQLFVEAQREGAKEITLDTEDLSSPVTWKCHSENPGGTDDAI